MGRAVAEDTQRLHCQTGVCLVPGSNQGWSGGENRRFVTCLYGRDKPLTKCDHLFICFYNQLTNLLAQLVFLCFFFYYILR